MMKQANKCQKSLENGLNKLIMWTSLFLSFAQLQFSFTFAVLKKGAFPTVVGISL
jgi:hypothetical protein